MGILRSRLDSGVHAGQSDTEITDAGLKELCEHKSLTTLDLSFTKVTTSELKELVGLPNLTALVPFHETSDADLTELKGLKNLTTLHLSYTQITDAGLFG